MLSKQEKQLVHRQYGIWADAHDQDWIDRDGNPSAAVLIADLRGLDLKVPVSDHMEVSPFVTPSGLGEATFAALFEVIDDIHAYLGTDRETAFLDTLAAVHRVKITEVVETYESDTKVAEDLFRNVY